MIKPINIAKMLVTDAMKHNGDMVEMASWQHDPLALNDGSIMMEIELFNGQSFLCVISEKEEN